jgi:hypothetical protein
VGLRGTANLAVLGGNLPPNRDTNSFRPRAALAICLLAPLLICATTRAAEPAGAGTRVAVQITELGCMRALLLLDTSALPEEKLLAQKLTDVDFRVFQTASPISGRVNHEIMKQRGQEAHADLVVYATVGSRLRNDLNGMKLFEGEATVQVYSPVSGELLASQTSRANGTRHADELDAIRSAREKALDAAAKEAITKSLAKAHKIIVHRVKITDIHTQNHLLAIMEYVQKLKDVYHVRQLTTDLAKGEATIEIVAAPKAESFWRAYLEKMPRIQIVVSKVEPNEALRKKYPSWFNPNE